MTQNTKTKGSTKIAIFCIIMLATASAQAMSIGAGPSDIDFKKMLKSGYGEKTVTVSTAGDEDLTVTVEPTGDIKDWITIKPANTFNLPPKGRFEIKVIVSPPPNAANGDYKGAVYIRAAPTSIVTDGTGSAIGGAIKIGITVSVSGEEVVEYKMQEVRVTDTEVGFPVRFNIAIANT